jgi:hypothetical protein
LNFVSYLGSLKDMEQSIEKQYEGTSSSHASPPPLPRPPVIVPVAQTCGYAIASLVLGIFSIFPGVYLGGIVFGILAIVFSKMATARISAGGASINGQGLATAGLVTGIVGLSISVFLMLFFGALAGFAVVVMAAFLKAMAAVPK